MTEQDLEHARRRAKRLLGAARDGDPTALARLREDRAPRLADAQHAVARELGHASWPALVADVRAAPPPSDERHVTTALSYAPGRPVVVRVRRRERRYVIDDLGAAVAGAGTPPGWRAIAERVVGEHALNVNRSGRVFVPAVEGRDIDALVAKTARASLDVYEALLDDA